MPGVGTRHPVGATLPALLQEDMFLQRFTAGLDEVLTPLHTTLDGLDSYLDPDLAPADFLDWLAGWVGLDLDPHWPVDVRRSLVRSAASVQDKRGTAHGVRDEIALLTGCAVDVLDPGGVACSATAGAPLPSGGGRGVSATGRDRCTDPDAVVVRVLGAAGELLDPDGEARTRLVRAVRAVVPAHLPVTVEVS